MRCVALYDHFIYFFHALIWFRSQPFLLLLSHSLKQYGSIFTVFTGICKTVIMLDKASHERVLDTSEDVLSFNRTTETFMHAILGWELVAPRAIGEHPHEHVDRIAGALTANTRPFFDHIVRPGVARWLNDLAAREDPVDWIRECDLFVMEMNLKCFLGTNEIPAKMVKEFVDLYDALETNGFTFTAIMFPRLPLGAPGRCSAIRKELRDRIRVFVREMSRFLASFRSSEGGTSIESNDVCIEANGFLRDFLTNPRLTPERRPWTEEEVVGTYVFASPPLLPPLS